MLSSTRTRSGALAWQLEIHVSQKRSWLKTVCVVGAISFLALFVWRVLTVDKAGLARSILDVSIPKTASG